MHPAFANIEDIMGIGVAVLAMMIPIVAILTHHQQKMTAIINGSQFRNEVEALRAEVQQLRDLVSHQATQLDRLNGLQAGSEPVQPAEPTLQSRLVQ